MGRASRCTTIGAGPRCIGCAFAESGKSFWRGGILPAIIGGACGGACRDIGVPWRSRAIGIGNSSAAGRQTERPEERRARSRWK